jgi:TRAP transporter TAXI family solute receptor
VRSRLTLWVVALVLTAAVVGLSLRYMDPFPPRRIWLATGQADGMYDVFGHEYQRRLAREGLRVELQRTAGSLENLERLLRGQVDVAFVQGGTYQLVQDPNGRLRGMAAVYREPLWIFYRGKPVTDGLASLVGRRLAIGAAGSGTEAISRALLGALGLPTTSPNLLSLPTAEARQRLEEGRIDAAFFVSSYRDTNVTALLRRPDVRLLGFTREVAFTRNFRYLSPVRIAEGLLDLKANLPREGITLMAPAALLVCRETLHPRGGGAAAHGRPRRARGGKPPRSAARLSHPRRGGRAAARRGRVLPRRRGVLHVARAALLGASMGGAGPPAPAPAARGLAAPLQDPPVADPLARQPDPRAPLRAVARRGGGRRERRPARVAS